MSVEILSIDKVILNALANDSVLQGPTCFNIMGNTRFPAGTTNIASVIFADIAPLKTPSPWIVFSMFNNEDVNAQGGYRAIQNSTYLIRVCALGIGYGGLKPYMDRIDDVIENLDFTLDSSNSVWVYKFQRQRTIRTCGSIDNDTWYQLGGVYDVVTSGCASESGTPINITNTMFGGAINTSSGNVTINLAPAIGNSQYYTYTNIGTGQIMLNCAGTDNVNGQNSLIINAYSSATIASFITGIWSIIMSYTPNQNIGANPEVAITATTSLSMPARNTTYKVSTTAATAITLPATSGSGLKLTFDFVSIPTYIPTFAYTGSDALVSGASLTGLIIAGGSFTLTDIATGTWSIE